MSWYVEEIECCIDAYAKTYHGANYDKDNQADYYLMSNPYQKSNQTISWGPHYMICYNRVEWLFQRELLILSLPWLKKRSIGCNNKKVVKVLDIKDMLL